MGSIIKVNEYKDFNNNDIMTSDGSGNVTINATGLKNTPYFAATMSGNQSLSQNTWTKVTFNTQTFDVGGNYDSTTNYRFTPTTAGKYSVLCNITFTSDGLLYDGKASIYKNGASTTESKFLNNNDKKHLGSFSVVNFVDMNGSSDYLEIYARGQGDTPIIVAAQTVFGVYKITGA